MKSKPSILKNNILTQQKDILMFEQSKKCFIIKGS
jgi:hypothetical protein